MDLQSLYPLNLSPIHNDNVLLSTIKYLFYEFAWCSCWTWSPKKIDLLSGDWRRKQVVLKMHYLIYMILLTCHKVTGSKRNLFYLLDQRLHEKISLNIYIWSFKTLHDLANIVLTRQQKHSLGLQYCNILYHGPFLPHLHVFSFSQNIIYLFFPITII